MKRNGKVTQSELDGVQYRRSPTWRIALSQMSQASTGIMCILGSYMSYLANAGYGVAVALSGILITVVCIFDGITDPIVASIVDNVNTKFGKIRLCMGIGWLMLSSMLIIMFRVLATGEKGPVVFTISYMLYIIGYTLFDIAARCIPPVMTNDPKQRPMVGVWGTFFIYIAPTISMLYFTNILLPKHGGEYNLPMLQEACIFVVIASGITMLISCFAISKVDKPENFQGIAEQKEKVSLKDMWAMLKSNKALQTYMWAVTSDRIAVLTSGQAVVTTLLSGILMRNMAAATVYGTIIMFLSMFFAIVGAKYTGKHGSKKSMVTWTIASMVIAVVTFVFYLSVDMSKIYVVPMLTAINFILGLALNGTKMACSTTVTSMMSDIVDYQMFETGKYMPAAVTATYSFLDKMIGAFSSTIALGLVALVGYTKVMPQPNDPATPVIFWITMFITLGMPMIGWIITLIAMKFSPLSREKMIEVQKYIAEHKTDMKNEA